MENVLIWLIWVAIIIGGIVSSASKAKKKREEEARRMMQEADKRASADSGSEQTARPVGGTFDKVLEELSRRLVEQPSPPVVARPLPHVSRPATSYDYYSIEEDYDATDGRVYGDDYSAEEPDAEQRYVGGERRGSYAAAGTGDYFEDEIVAYERLAARRAKRSTIAAASPASVETEAADPAVDLTDNTRTSLQDVLGGEFDLRRAVVEAEILTPKYI